MSAKSKVASKGAAAIATAIAPAPVKVVESSIVERVRPMDKVASLFIYGADDSVTLVKDSQLTATELFTFLSERVQKLGSESVRLANTLRIARMLPDVKDGDKSVSAFQWVTAKLKADSATVSAFNNIAYLVPAIDVKEQNGLTVSAFTVKNALPWLRDKDVIDENGKFKPEKAGVDPIATKLKTGATGAEIGKELKRIRDEAKAAEEARKKAALGIPTEKPDPTVAIVLDLKGIIARLDKVMAEGDIAKVRASVTGTVRDLAKLAGFDLVQIKS